MIRQLLLQKVAHVIDVEFAAFASRHVCDQVLVAFIPASDDDYLAHGRMIRRRRFNLAQFDAETADLNLVVDAPNEFDLPGRAIANQVARLVKARVGLAQKIIANEPLGIQLRTIQITLRESIATDVKFSRHADRRRRCSRSDNRSAQNH